MKLSNTKSRRLDIQLRRVGNEIPEINYISCPQYGAETFSLRVAGGETEEISIEEIYRWSTTDEELALRLGQLVAERLEAVETAKRRKAAELAVRVEYTVRIHNLDSHRLETEEMALRKVGIHPRTLPGESIWRIEVEKSVGGKKESGITYATEQQLVAVMDVGALGADLKPAKYRRIKEDEYQALADVFAEQGIFLPFTSAEFAPTDLGAVAVRAIEESVALNEAGRTFQLSLHSLRRQNGSIILNRHDDTPESVKEQIRAYCDWVYARLQSALDVESQRGDWGRLLDIVRRTRVRTDPASRDGMRSQSSWEEPVSALRLARIPLGRVLSQAFSSEELERLNRFHRLSNKEAVKIEARAEMPGLIEKLIKFLTKAEEDLYKALAEGRYK